jgi:MFS family permease
MSDSVIYRERDLYSFVTSRFISTLAIQVQSVAIGWQVYDMQRTPLALGLVGLCQFLPMFLLTLPAGDITDRFNQRRVYSLAAGLQATCSALFLALSIFRPHTAWMYFLVLVLFGAARGFAGPSGSSLLPFLVPPERISKSLAISSSFFTAGLISGPALAGFLYELGRSLCVSFASALARLASPAAGGASPRGPGARERVAEGVKFGAHPVVRAPSLSIFCRPAGRCDRHCRSMPATFMSGPLGWLLRSAGGRRLSMAFPHPLADQSRRRQEVHAVAISASPPWCSAQWSFSVAAGAVRAGGLRHSQLNIRSLIQFPPPMCARPGLRFPCCSSRIQRAGGI